MQTLLSSAYVDDHDGHLTFVLVFRWLWVSVQMLLRRIIDGWVSPDVREFLTHCDTIQDFLLHSDTA